MQNWIANVIIITRTQMSIVVRVNNTSECKSTSESSPFVQNPRVEESLSELIVSSYGSV